MRSKERGRLGDGERGGHGERERRKAAGFLFESQWESRGIDLREFIREE